MPLTVVTNGSLTTKAETSENGMEIVNLFSGMINMGMILWRHSQVIAMMEKAIILKRELRGRLSPVQNLQPDIHQRVLSSMSVDRLYLFNNLSE